MSITDEDVYESLYAQLDDLGDCEPGETVCLVIPDGCTEEQYQRVLKQVEEDREAAE